MAGTILVVEDDAAIREALGQLLSDAGYGVAYAENGARALDYLRSQKRPCVILLDLMMPVMDGWEFRVQQKSDAAFASIPVVVVTAAGTYRKKLDVEEVLQKPIDFDRLMPAIERYCGAPDRRSRHR